MRSQVASSGVTPGRSVSEIWVEVVRVEDAELRLHDRGGARRVGGRRDHVGALLRGDRRDRAREREGTHADGHRRGGHVDDGPGRRVNASGGIDDVGGHTREERGVRAGLRIPVDLRLRDARRRDGQREQAVSGGVLRAEQPARLAADHLCRARVLGREHGAGKAVVENDDAREAGKFLRPVSQRHGDRRLRSLEHVHRAGDRREARDRALGEGEGLPRRRRHRREIDLAHREVAVQSDPRRRAVVGDRERVWLRADRDRALHLGRPHVDDDE